MTKRVVFGRLRLALTVTLKVSIDPRSVKILVLVRHAKSSRIRQVVERAKSVKLGKRDFDDFAPIPDLGRP
ncbi:MAG TPA: hypothetical protein VFM44_04695 [Gemmatimonadota bacterium]|nr:hypothetical protein [Gemmatimonadota bacterium]